MLKLLQKNIQNLAYKQPLFLKYNFCKQITDYDKIDITFLNQVQQSCKFLLNINDVKLQNSFQIFRENIFPPENRQNIKDQFKNIYGEQISKDVYDSLKHIFQFLDRGYVGFLSGDLDPQILIGIKQNLDKAFKQMQQDKKKNDIIHQLYQNLKQENFINKQFGIPENGIKYPDHESRRNLFERQLILEDESNSMAIEKFMNLFDSLNDLEKSHTIKLSSNYIVQWFPKICQLVKEEQQNCQGGQLKGDRRSYASYLLKMSAEKLTIIGLTELMKGLLGQAQNKIQEKEKEQKDKNYYYLISKKLFSDIGKQIDAQMTKDEQIQQLKQQDLNEEHVQNYQDQLLISKIKKDIKIEMKIPKIVQVKYKYIIVINWVSFSIFYERVIIYFQRTIKINNSLQQKVSLITPGYNRLNSKTAKYIGIQIIEDDFIQSLIEQIQKQDSQYIQIERSLPMIYKPSPWIDFEIGGYYQKPTQLMRIKDNNLQEQALSYANLTRTFKVLNSINETPWKINKKILKIVEEIWENGGQKGQIPQRYYNYENFIYSYQMKETYKRKEREELSKQIQLQRDQNSLRCNFLLQLNVAKAFKDCNKIYFPHNLDFRGRAYPIPPHLNHIGADLSRGLLLFAKGKELGENGLRWLKTHLANKMGKDKLNSSQRLQFVDEQMELIKKIANDPLKNQEWLDCEDSWQTLAAIFELQAALDSPDPTKYISNLHIHQDGSCNGLQHYAALGRDLEGAQQVNLEKLEKPGDVYTHVSKMVEAKILNDLENPDHDQLELAKMLSGKIKRKIVMTSVYGVTFIGARQQILRQIKDYKVVPEEFYYQASFYVATKTLECIKDLFSGAHEIKKWLISCANIISRQNFPISWITPLGLPIVQPYRKVSSIDTIQTVVQNISLQRYNENLPVQKTKQQSAFPPNFIHSLDSTHMLYTAMACSNENITFASVHDSFWTHAADVDKMSQILREQFINLHSQSLLEELKVGFEIRFPDLQFPSIPQRGEFNLDNVKNSEYFFS